jgi:diacylglycerol kinase (ATP)
LQRGGEFSAECQQSEAISSKKYWDPAIINGQNHYHSSMQPPDTIVICCSPKAGSGGHAGVVPALVEMATRAGFIVRVSQSLAETQELVATASSRLRCVVAAGGDGTLSLLVQTLPVSTPFLPLPLGTENLLALKFGYSRDPAVVLKTILEGQRFQIDAGLANDKIFLIMATAGFDAEVTRRMSLQRSGHIRRWSYGKPICGALRSYTYPPVRVYGDGELEGLVAAWAMAFNLPCYAMGLSLVSNCSEQDGMLDTCLMMKPGIFAGCAYLGNVLLGRHLRLTSVRQLPAKEMRWESDQSVPYQLDGDFAGYLPVQISVLPNRVTLIAPQLK